MNRRVTLILLLLSLTRPLTAQEILHESVIGLRIVGSLSAGVPVIIPGRTVAVAFDVKDGTERDFRLSAVHCDKNWVETRTEFVNDPHKRKGRSPIQSGVSASAVRAYGRTYSAVLPGGGLEPFAFSGNYEISIIDEELGIDVARFRVIVAERDFSYAMHLARRRIPMQVQPWDEGHEVSIGISDEMLPDDPLDPLYLQLVRIVDIYKNREWDRRERIDINNVTESAWVDGVGTDSIVFTAGRILPGNEYRRIDVRNAEHYPQGTTLKSRDGADLSRFFFPGKPDRNGSSRIVSSALLAEYEMTEFELWWQTDQPPTSVHVVGDFSFWRVDPAWQLQPSGDEGRYILRRPLKRGVYDYQYVINKNDWITVEGSSWETTNVYTAIVYYSDMHFGGFDRAIAAGQVTGNGAPRKDANN